MAPEPQGRLPAQQLFLRDTLVTRVSSYFRDANGDALTYSASSSHDDVATAGIAREELIVVGVSKGAAVVTVTATDPAGLTATQTADVTVLLAERDVLEVFFEATGGRDWTDNTNWLSDAPLHTWHGVLLNPSGNVRLLDLENNNLVGSLPPELGELEDLRQVSVSVNLGLEGEIPPEVLALELIRLDAWSTGLCIPRTADFEFHITRPGWVGYVCGETEPGFQIDLRFSGDIPDYVREAMDAGAGYWMEILRDTNAPDLFGEWFCFLPDEDRPSLVIDDIIVKVEFGEEFGTGAGICGRNSLLRHRIPSVTSVYLNAAHVGRFEDDARYLELVARHELGHAFGIGTLWRLRGQLEDASTADELLDTYVVSPLAIEAFDAAGGTSYTGPKVPVHQHGAGRNSHWRTEVFGSELMSWGWGDDVPTSVVTLQGLADLGYTVDLSLADPYTLPGAAAPDADAPPLVELRWEARKRTPQ